MTEPQVSPSQAVNSGSRLQLAYQRVFEEMCGLTTLTTINIVVPNVYMLGSGALPRIRAYREPILALPKIRAHLVENLEDYLLALGHAQALYLASTAPVASIPELYARLLKQREILLADCTALAARGLLSGDKLKELRGPISHADTAFDVLALSSFVRGNWTAITGKSGLALSDLELAETLADQLLSALGERAVSDEQASAAALNRARAFTLFVAGYDEVRRGLTYLRWHDGDLEEIAPSLYSSRTGRRKRPETNAEEAEDESSTAPAGTTPESGATGTTPPAGSPDSPFSS